MIKALSEQGKSNIVDQFVMVATPQIGTPQALGGLLHGDEQNILFGLLLDKQSSVQLGHNMQSAYNLLPLESYFNKVSDSVISFNSSISSAFNYSLNNLLIDKP